MLSALLDLKRRLHSLFRSAQIESISPEGYMNLNLSDDEMTRQAQSAEPFGLASQVPNAQSLSWFIGGERHLGFALPLSPPKLRAKLALAPGEVCLYNAKGASVRLGADAKDPNKGRILLHLQHSDEAAKPGQDSTQNPNSEEQSDKEAPLIELKADTDQSLALGAGSMSLHFQTYRITLDADGIHLTTKQGANQGPSLTLNDQKLIVQGDLEVQGKMQASSLKAKNEISAGTVGLKALSQRFKIHQHPVSGAITGVPNP